MEIGDPIGNNLNVSVNTRIRNCHKYGGEIERNVTQKYRNAVVTALRPIWFPIIFSINSRTTRKIIKLCRWVNQ